ncbi:transcription elongation factor A protein 1-like [Rhopilema esculentum]|uniref:transcription elongation factor A protein 1-like n=1 Tax=Rhopilema esculentum TaxID=499914 RepID=UPI0031DD5B3B
MSAVEDEVSGIGKRLEKLVEQGQADSAQAMESLKKLKDIPVTLDILQKTRIGMSVNVLRKASTKEDLQALAKSLIKNWKKLLDSQEKAKGLTKSQDKCESPSLPRNSSESNMSTSSNISQAAAAISEPNGNGIKSLNRSNSKEAVAFPPIKGDVAVRQKCREMLENSLKGEDDLEINVQDVAAHIEEAIFLDFKDSGMKYRNRVKSRVMNLRDKKNPLLKRNVLTGSITAQRFAVMKPEEMASDEMRKIRDDITKQAIKDHQLATTGGTGTDQFKCGKCGKRNCTYNQVQTRSADEPMTTFVLCNECGKRWKFC